MTHVVVIGGGIAGLVATRRLGQAGASVTLLEASPKLGGLVNTVEAWGRPVDVGAESLFLAAPALRQLVRELRLEPEMIPAARLPTWVAVDGRLEVLPEGVGPAGPTRLAPLVKSGILSPAGLIRAGLEVGLPGRPTADVSVGAFVRRRFGHEVADRLVAPLLGNLHAGSINRLSLAATLPQTHHAASAHRSLLLAALRARRAAHGNAGSPGGAGHTFATFRTGLGALVDALVDQCVDADLRVGARVREVRARQRGYDVHLEGGDLVAADGVVVAVPAASAARLVAPLAPGAAAGLAELRAASVAVALLAYPAGAAEEASRLRGSGLLVGPREERLLKAATFLSSKWLHLGGAPFVVRASAGRFGDNRVAALSDEQLMQRLHRDLADLTGLTEDPVGASVQRWPGAMPQLEVGHRDRIAAVRTRLRGHPGVVLAGAGYDGVGLSAAAGSGERAASTLMERHKER